EAHEEEDSADDGKAKAKVVDVTGRQAEVRVEAKVRVDARDDHGHADELCAPTLHVVRVSERTCLPHAQARLPDIQQEPRGSNDGADAAARRTAGGRKATTRGAA